MSKANATPDDIEKYIAAHPVEGERLRNINKASTVSGMNYIMPKMKSEILTYISTWFELCRSRRNRGLSRWCVESKTSN